MKVRRQITGALCGLLDTLGSRYSDYDGYWMFGLIVREVETLSFNLCCAAEESSSSPVVAEAWLLAHTKFTEQLQRAHIPVEYVSEATLTIKRTGDLRVGPVNGHISQGYQLSLAAEAVSDLGKKYRAERFLFAAPHDPNFEQRSTRRLGPNPKVGPSSPGRLGSR